MDSVLHDYDDDEETAAELSELELEELIVTKFVGRTVTNNEEEKIETARAAGSPMELCLSPISREADDFILEEHPCLVRPIQEQINSDNAVQLMNRILRSTEYELRNYANWNIFESSRKWKNTNRASERNLICSILPLVDHRPTHLHVYCRRLIESDLAEFISTALIHVDPPSRYSSLFRISLKTEMPLKQFLGQLGKMVSLYSNIQVRDAWVTALRQSLDGTCQKFITREVGDFSELEHKLLKPSSCPMIASVRIPFEYVGRPYVNVDVGYHNEVDHNGRRFKSIVIEQFVSPLPGKLSNRRVSFGTPLIEKVHTFEIDEHLPFHPLRFPFKIQNLIQCLENVDMSSFQNVTFRT